MLTAAKQTTVVLNDEYFAHYELIDRIQQRLRKDIELLELEPIEQQDTLEYISDKVTIFRFLKDVDFSEDKVIERLIDTIMWRIDNNINRITYQHVSPEFFQESFSFFYKHDLIGRPVAIIQMKHFPKFTDKSKTLSDFMQPFVCLVMEIARQMTRDITRKNEDHNNGHTLTLISQISIIIDIAKAPFVPIDSALMQSLKNITNTRFPGYIGSVYIVNFGWMYQGIWQVAKLLLSEHAKSRISFISSKELDQVVNKHDLLRDLGGTDEFIWSVESDVILQTYATEKRFPTLPAICTTSITSSIRRSSVSSTSSSLFYDAPDYLSSPYTYHDTIRSTFTSACPSVYATPGSLTPINSHIQLARTSEPRYFLTGFHLGDAFLTSFFNIHNKKSLNNGINGDELSHRLNELIKHPGPMDDILLLNHTPVVHFPHMLPDTHPQSIFVTSPVKHHLMKAEQKLIRMTRRLFRLSFAYNGAVYWVMLYVFLRGPVEHTFRRCLARMMAGNHQQITYATVGVTATLAAVLSTSFSQSIHTNENIKKHR